MSNDQSGVSRRDLSAALGATLGAAVIAGPLTARGQAREAVVETTAGRVRGSFADGAYGFMGVPYGADTSGPNRFLPPRRPAPWAGVRDAPQLRRISPQTNPKVPPPPPGSLFAIIRESNADETEDCLNVCVWTPALDRRRRPVMVWLHGGGYASGSGSNPSYYGARLAARGDVVVVNVTHRLNAFGHTYLGDILGERFAASGNAGVLDMQAALIWVRENIERFGGDPSRVMIFGESGGGGKVAALLAMPRAKGLLHRAAMESGSVRTLAERPEATQATEALLAELGIARGDAARLQQVPVQQLLVAYFAVTARLGGGLGNFGPVRDGAVIPHHPFDPVPNPLQEDVPLLIGTNETEATLFSLSDEALFHLDLAGLSTRMTYQVGAKNAAAAVALYKELYPAASPSDLYFIMVTDRAAGFRRGATQIAEMKAAQGPAPVFLYELLWRTPAMDGRLRSPHGLEISLVFNNPDTQWTAPITGGGARAQAMAEVVSDAWTAFAHSGDPSTPRLAWPAYDLERRTTMLLSERSRAAPDPNRRTRMFWDGVANTFL